MNTVRTPLATSGTRRTNKSAKRHARSIRTGDRDRACAICDIENQTIWEGRRLPVNDASAVFDEIGYFVTGLPTVAAFAPSLLGPYVPHLAARGWGLDMVAAGPDAADLALMNRARFAIEHGCTDLVIVSGDHIFAELAEHARLHVVSHPDRLSRELERVAASVSYLGSGLGAPTAA